MSTVIPTTLETFPECPGYGFTAQPQYLVQINTRQGGFEGVKRRWPRPLSIYPSIPLGPRDESVVQNVYYFTHAMGGRATIFRFKDETDFQSSPLGLTPEGTDQPLQFVTTDGFSGHVAYFMQKIYTVGSITQVREITQPIGSTIRVFNGSNVEQDDFTVDENNGLIVPGGSFDGVALTWGGEFAVPVRFDSDPTFTVDDEGIQSASFALREKRIKLPDAWPY